MKKTYLGIDLGTTGTKSTLFDQFNNEIGRGYKGYELISPFDLAFEQNPSDWEDAVVASVKGAIGELDCSVLSLSVSAQGGSFFFADVDDNGKVIPLTNAFTWMDKRATLESEELNSKIEKDYFYYRTGSRLGAGSFPAKYLWLKKHNPEIIEKTKIILSTSDYIYYLMTGKFCIDYTSSYMMDVFNVKEKDYDSELLSLIGLDKNKLPSLLPAGAVIGEMLPEFAEKLGINKGVKVVCGAHDQYAANIGSNYFDNALLISSGTTWVVFGRSEELALTDSHFASCVHPIGNYGVFSSAVSSGVVIEWEKKLFSVDFEEMNREIPLRDFQEDLLVYPFISGSGGYRGEKSLSYSIDNAVFRYDKFDIIKATMEGVAFEIREIITRLKKSKIKQDKIIIAGGAVKSPAWMQILADVLGQEIYISNKPDRCCYGAYSIARKGVDGEFTTFEFDGKVAYPQKELVEKYNEKFIKYSKKFLDK
ncbi:MAG: hypothetical protein IJW43_03590 [Clostridia bacterium]|nr:hypothetical protein [Clostridia bacterium]